MRFIFFQKISGIFLLIAFSGCATVGPDYVPPEKKVPENFSTQLEKATIEQPEAEETNDAPLFQ